MIRDSGIPKFMHLRAPVNCNLRVLSWRKHLCDYFDKQLVNSIEFEFPLDYDRTRHLESTLNNHASARFYSDHVDKYLEEELKFEVIPGPFDIPPLIYIFLPSRLGRNPDPTLVAPSYTSAFLKFFLLMMGWPKICI